MRDNRIVVCAHFNPLYLYHFGEYYNNVNDREEKWRTQKNIFSLKLHLKFDIRSLHSSEYFQNLMCIRIDSFHLNWLRLKCAPSLLLNVVAVAIGQIDRLNYVTIGFLNVIFVLFLKT